MSFMAYDFDLACALERESAFVRPEVLAGPEHDCLARRRTTTELQSVVNMRSFKAIFTAMAGPVALARLPQDVYVVGSLPCLCLSPPRSVNVEAYTRAWPTCFSLQFSICAKNQNIATRATPRSGIGAPSADSASRGCASGDFLVVIYLYLHF